MDRIADQFLNRDALVASATLLGLGLGQTVRLVAAVLLVAIVLGLGVAWARTRASAWARALAVAYVDLARTTPPLVSLVVVCYGLPLLGLPALDTFAAAVVALGLLHAAHVGEIYRGGALAVGRGQREAARALALSDLQALRWVLLPQAIRAIIPPLTSQATQVVRDSPLALMMPTVPSSRRAAALVALAVLFTGAVTRADVVVRRDGSTLRGRVVSVDAEAVVVEVDASERRVPRAEVAEIRFDREEPVVRVEIRNIDMWEVHDFLTYYYDVDLLHQITAIMIKRDENAGGTKKVTDRKDLTLTLTTEAIMLEGAETRRNLIPVPSAFAAVGGWRGFDSVAFNPDPKPAALSI